MESKMSRFDLIPHFGEEEDYFVGNGIVGAAVNSFSEATAVIGPDYTSPNFIVSEKTEIIVNNKPFKVAPEMHRVRNCGIFLGTICLDEIQVEVIDFTVDRLPFLFRIINTKNTSSAAKAIGVQVSADTGKRQAEIVNGTLQITALKDEWCFGNQETKNWADRFCEINFVDSGKVLKSNELFTISSNVITLKKKECHAFLLYHYNYYTRDENIIKSALKEPFFLLEQSIEYWKKWMKTGNFCSDASKASDVIESCLLAVKMQQNRDGGFIAGIHKYANSYIRDSHGAHRLFIATGHYEECKKLIQNIHTRWEIAGFIPNWWSMGSDSFIGESFHNNASEITAYYLLMLRDYLTATKDFCFAESVFSSAKWAADAQLYFLKNNNFALTFNGDETEQYVCKNDGEEYGGFPSTNYWKHSNLSFSSTVAALTSLSFFSGYLQRRNTENPYAEYLDIIRDMIDKTFLNETTHVHSWAVDAESGKPMENIMTNFNLIPLWIGAELNNYSQNYNALKMVEYINPTTGFLPNSVPDVNGFCGHSLGLLLYCLVKLGETAKADKVFSTVMNSPLLGRWGTVSEFYGPGGVPNGHNYRSFESGILGEALLTYNNTH